jgi:hypothetical protein
MEARCTPIELAPPAPPPEVVVPGPPERPVFAAQGTARPRMLRMAGWSVAVLVTCWLVALVLGAFGFGPVAGVHFPWHEAGVHRAATAAHEAAREARPVPQTPDAPAAQALRDAAASSSPRPAGARATARPQRRVAASRPEDAPPRRGGSPGATESPGTFAAPPRAPSAPASTPAATAPQQPQAAQPAPQPAPPAAQSTPPGSSSTAPGSRSQSGSAPGREHSNATPDPGAGRTHATGPAG